MDREEIRLRLETACTPAKHGGSSSATMIPAAVLVGLIGYPEGPQIILTERTAHLSDHPSQVSLPGGRVEADDEGPAAAALREASEEIGLASDRVEILGCLPPYDTVTGYRVYPLVGWIEPPVELTPEAREVADVFQVPLSFVLDPANHLRGSINRGGKRHGFYVLPYPDRRIWGATAGILVSLARVLAP